MLVLWISKRTLFLNFGHIESSSHFYLKGTSNLKIDYRLILIGCAQL